MNEKLLFASILEIVDSAYSEYDTTIFLKDIILNGFKGINNMTEKEIVSYIKSSYVLGGSLMKHSLYYEELLSAGIIEPIHDDS